MSVLYTLNDVMEQYSGKYVVAVTVRDYRGMANEFSVVKAFDDMNDAVSMRETLCQFDMDSVVIPCLTDDEFETEMTPAEIAYVFRALYNKQRRDMDLKRTLTFDEVIAIFCHFIE